MDVADISYQGVTMWGERTPIVHNEAHPTCIACSPANPAGLQLQFDPCPDETVEGRFDCGERYAGYPGMVHGGVVATLLDSAMTHCLFAHGYRAFTAELTVRYHDAVVTNAEAIIRANLERKAKHLYLLTASVSQQGRVKATARAKFMDGVQHSP